MSAFTPERIAELRALCDSATPGGWQYDTHNHIIDRQGRIILSIPDHPEGDDYSFHASEVRARSDWYNESAANAKLTTASRTALPDALDEIERQTKEIERLKEALNDVVTRNIERRGPHPRRKQRYLLMRR